MTHPIIDLMNPVTTLQPIALSAGQHVRLGGLGQEGNEATASAQAAQVEPMTFLLGHVVGLALTGALVGWVASKNQRTQGKQATKTAVAFVAVGSTLTAMGMYASDVPIPQSLMMGEAMVGLGALAYNFTK